MLYGCVLACFFLSKIACSSAGSCRFSFPDIWRSSSDADVPLESLALLVCGS
ncbi:hypothetical protein PR003_g6377 [Phytophthora rubi]|uniref:RxLR effector protein n=1 Tax=Phytophthora rubi TaxID=129364 RepID=A0A6A3NA12_9STRA|nr:hypothetical protein PR002_g6337 [Phytophthora rubi]KAE9042859.1 hypothetical protein PR001_g6022 [Phytophthora rubi]KAE9348508.1 hypothetical protein PR003_g6377 [Phytophthora rubi]